MKTTVGVFFGGRSTEHEISVISALQAINAFNKEKYEIIPIYITKQGRWFSGDALLEVKNYRDMAALQNMCAEVYMIPEYGDYNLYRKKRALFGNNIWAKLDVVIPVLLFAGYNGQPRLFEVEAVGGFGWLRLNDFYETGEGANHLASKAGVNFNFNLGEKKAWTVAIKPAILWDMSMWDADRAHSHPNFNANYANWEITAGVVYHFKNSNGKHHMTKVRAYDASEVSALNATINNLRQDVNSKDESMRNTANKLRNEEQKSADLERALKECQNQGPKVITNNKKTLESVVTFRQGKIVIDASQQPNVERIATYLKNHKEAKVNILGYASPEGSAEVNERIANQRAEAVKNMLVNKYRIDARRITAKGQGVGYMFEEPDWNRVSICTIVED